EAVGRAMSSPLLEGASVNGSRGVIINVTGGPDLSLVEVSEASSIVQEAADEDANIIFGAVVDPALKGKVKITVIATGFGPPAAARPAASAAQTPVDLTQDDRPRARAEAAAMSPPMPPAPDADRLSPLRLTIARRSLLEMQAAPSAGSGGAPPIAQSSGGNGAGAPADHVDPDFDLTSTFDVP